MHTNIHFLLQNPSLTPQAVRIAGSSDQRDLVNLTLIAAYIKADRPDEASALIARRIHPLASTGAAGHH